MLVERGANRGIKDRDGATALDLFRRSGRDAANIESIIARLVAI
jgi:hypothetical protein